MGRKPGEITYKKIKNMPLHLMRCGAQLLLHGMTDADTTTKLVHMLECKTDVQLFLGCRPNEAVGFLVGDNLFIAYENDYFCLTAIWLPASKYIKGEYQWADCEQYRFATRKALNKWFYDRLADENRKRLTA